MASHSDRVLQFVTRVPGRDDDEICALLAIRPRQTINQICRALESAGRIRRSVGRLGKIANYPIASEPTSVPAERADDVIPPAIIRRPRLTRDALLMAGFEHIGEWKTEAGRLSCDRRLPSEPGVYAFLLDGLATYAGVATVGLARRLHFYARPGRTQRTSRRVNRLLLEAIGAHRPVEIYAAKPGHSNWNGLPVNLAAGLELGLIQSYDLPWNIRGVRNTQ